jgi:hypothetical protein
MGRTIPSFRLLIDIEKLEWKEFRKHLCRQDKKIFTKLFALPKLYCHSLSNIKNPLIIQSIFMAILFHNEKIMYSRIKDNLKKKEEGEGGNHLKESSEDQNYKKIIENWRKFKDCLNENDKNTFIKIIKECYFQYSLSILSNNKEKFNPCLTQSLLMALILHQQKQIDKIKEKQNVEY